MLIDVLISTTYQRHTRALSLAEDIFNKSGIRSIIICQTFDLELSTVAPLNFENFFCSIYFVQSRGLSISRNTAISKSNARFGWILDDDVQVCKDGILSLLATLREINIIGALSCKFTDEFGRTRKKYEEVAFTHTRSSVMKVSSIEIVLNLDFIKEKGIEFDTQFGLGSRYPSGEENIILTDIISAGGRVEYLPLTLCFHPLETSSSILYSDVQWQAKGALIRRSFGILGVLMLVPFFLKRATTGQARLLNVASGLRHMLSGFLNVKY